jgi:hypothetical protein
MFLLIEVTSGQLGQNHGRKIIFGIVKMLRMVTEADVEDGTRISPQDDSRILEADLFGEGIWNEQSKQLRFTRGIESYPLPLPEIQVHVIDTTG